MKTYKYELPPGCSIESITIKETTGKDDLDALLASEVSELPEQIEQIHCSIVSVDGEPVLPGTAGKHFSKWSSKTRSVVKKLYSRVNTIDRRTLYGYIEKAENTKELIDGRIHMTFDLPHGLGLSFVTFREMFEEDERAGSLAGNKGLYEMMSRCIVDSSDGKLSTNDLIALPSKTTDVLAVYWNGMNFVPDEELIPLAKAAEMTATDTDNQSSQNGCGSPMEVDADSQSALENSED